DTEGSLVRAMACGFDMALLAPFDLFLQGDLITVYRGQITKDSGDLKCSLDEHSGWYPHAPLDAGAFWRLREACAGMGGIAMGLNQLGISAIAHLDANEYCCNALKLNDAKGVIHGDINNYQDVEKLHGMGNARKSLLAAGFPCQPFSTQGDRLGHQDPRSTTFWGVLRAAWLLQSSTLILECVANVARFPFITEGLNTLANMMGYQEEQQLQLTHLELSYMHNPAYGDDTRLLSTTSSSYKHSLLFRKHHNWIDDASHHTQAIELYNQVNILVIFNYWTQIQAGSFLFEAINAIEPNNVTWSIYLEDGGSGQLGLSDAHINLAMSHILYQHDHVGGTPVQYLNPIDSRRVLEKCYNPDTLYYMDTIAIFDYDGHWAVLLCTTSPANGFHAYIYDGLPGRATQQHDHTCGTIALLHTLILLNYTYNLDEVDILQQHNELLAATLSDLEHHSARGPAAGGDHVEHQLALGSRPHSNFLFVHHDELMQKIQEKAESNFQPQEDQGQEDDQTIEQIPFSSIGPDSKGIAFTTIAELSPYLKEGITIGDGPLAALTTRPIPHEQRGMLVISDLQIPAKHIDTQEPVLIQGSLVQLSSTHIQRVLPHADLDAEPIKTQTIKITIFQDQWPGDWNTLKEGPVKALLAAQPILTLCRIRACGNSCPKYHPPVEEDNLEKVLLDIWGAVSSTQPPDPWLNGSDPWSSSTSGSLATSHSHASTSVDKIQQVEARLKSNMRTAIRKEIADFKGLGADDDSDMGVEATSANARLLKLEADVSELRQHSHKFEGWFKEAAAANERTNHRLAEVSQQAAAQQTELHKVQSHMTQDMTCEKTCPADSSV
ncbi:unnamed protein product, partial [Effrenium voratum]